MGRGPMGREGDFYFAVFSVFFPLGLPGFGRYNKTEDRNPGDCSLPLISFPLMIVFFFESTRLARWTWAGHTLFFFWLVTCL